LTFSAALRSQSLLPVWELLEEVDMMKLRGICVASALFLACGCTQGTPGGPGVQSQPGSPNQTTNKPVIGESKETFSLRTPIISTSVKQGETKSASIAIQRGTNFDDDVELKFGSLPTGVTLDPANPTLKHDDKEVKINVTAAPDAAVGDFTVSVTGHPSKGGPDATNDFKLTVSAK